MDPLTLANHLLNFVAPALAVAALTLLSSRLLMKKPPLVRTWWSQLAINFIVGAGVLAAGLWFFGRDGKMATYAALVLACASCQWVLSRGWKA